MSHLTGLPSQADRVLVVANRTADSNELVNAMHERAALGHARFTLVVPATPHGLAWAADMSAGIPEARRQMAAAQERLRDEGLWIDDIRLGSPDPLAAVHDAVNFELCLPHRVQRSTGLPVTHVVAQRSRGGRFERVATPVAEPIAA